MKIVINYYILIIIILLITDQIDLKNPNPKEL